MTEVQSKLLDCQNRCSRNLGMFRTDKTEEFFGSYFHYLEYGYYFCESLLSISFVDPIAVKIGLFSKLSVTFWSFLRATEQINLEIDHSSSLYLQ